MEAYYDCWALKENYTDADWQEAQKHRNLNFRASKAVSRDRAIKILQYAIPRGYNEFNADLLKLLPKDAKIFIAREGSVCIYVNKVISESLASEMMADENDEVPYGEKGGSEWRMWWD